jgi:hypothetical protein
MRRSAFTVFLLVGVLDVACSAGGQGPGAGVIAGQAELFIGAFEDSDAKIALVHDDVNWAAYVCGGASTLSSLTTWFQGDLASVGGRRVSAVSDDKGIDATFGADGATGVLTMDDLRAVRFDAPRVPRGAPAGIFQSLSDGCRTGLIVPPSGQGTPQSVYCEDVGSAQGAATRIFEQVTPVSPVISQTDDVVAARLESNARIIQLEKVVLPLDSTRAKAGLADDGLPESPR